MNDRSPLAEDLAEQLVPEGVPPKLKPIIDQRFNDEIQIEFDRLARLYRTEGTLDLAFLVYLQRMARFGYFVYGPISIDVRLIEEIVERGIASRDPVTRVTRDGGHWVQYDDAFVRFTLLLIEEVRRSGRSRMDELHWLLAFMRCGEGLPGRVFGELGVTPDQVEAHARLAPGAAGPELERLYSPEEAADYLGVHVQTVRSWIRSGRLGASRLTGQRALRIRASDLNSVLEPVDPADFE
jgi:excisionase family DNA binding protein